MESSPYLFSEPQSRMASYVQREISINNPQGNKMSQQDIFCGLYIFSGPMCINQCLVDVLYKIMDCPKLIISITPLF